MANRLQPASRLLKSSDPKERHKACRLLHGFKSKRAVGLLVDALEDEDTWVRRSAVISLFSVPEGAVDPLVTRLLSDPDEKGRQISAGALGFVDAPDLSDVFRRALNDPSDDIHLSACVSLYRLGAREPLLNAVRHPSPLIRLQACENLIVRWESAERGDCGDA